MPTVLIRLLHIDLWTNNVDKIFDLQRQFMSIVHHQLLGVYLIISSVLCRSYTSQSPTPGQQPPRIKPRASLLPISTLKWHRGSILFICQIANNNLLLKSCWLIGIKLAHIQWWIQYKRCFVKSFISWFKVFSHIISIFVLVLQILFV